MNAVSTLKHKSACTIYQLTIQPSHSRTKLLSMLVNLAD